MTAPSPKKSLPPPVDERRRQRRPDRADDGRERDAEDDADQPADDTLGERLADDLAHDDALLPAERLERADLADALADRRERQEQRDEEGGQRREHGERDAEAMREVGRVDERAGDAVGDVAGARDLGARERGLDVLLHARDVVAAVGPDEDDVDLPLLGGELLELRERHVDVRGLAAERRAHEPDDGERRPVEVDGGADLQPLATRVRLRHERLAPPSGGMSLRDERRGDDADVGLCHVDAADRVRRARDVGLRRVDHLPERLLRAS